VWNSEKSLIFVHIYFKQLNETKKGDSIYRAAGDYYQTWKHEKTSGFKSGHPHRKKQ